MGCAGCAGLARVRRGARAGVLVAIGLGGLGLLAGCQKPLFPVDAPRSQYDRIDTIRDRRAPSHYFDEFGTRRPNIRGRLLTSE